MSRGSRGRSFGAFQRGAAVAAVVPVLGVTLALGAGPAQAAPTSTGPLGTLLSGLLAGALAPHDGFAGLAALDSGYDPRGDAGSLYNLETATGVRTLWARGDTGRGVGVALVDSGVASLPGLGGVQDGVDLSSTAGTRAQGSDGFGHGTAMAGIIAGHDGPLSGPLLARLGAGQFEGVAPDATVIDVKVAEASGWTDPSRVIAGIAWAIQHKTDRDIRVINLSYGTDATDSYRSDLLAYAVEQAWKSGIVVVASAGNGGAGTAQLADPAMDPYVIAVGAAQTATTTGGVASFSQRGSATRTPDVVAPGVGVQSLRAPGSSIANALATTAGIQPRFLSGSGTSEATAYVSGEVALMLQDDPSLTPDQVKARLTASADPLTGVSARLAGAGLTDVVAAESSPAADATQTWAPALGTGTLDAARGSSSWIAAGATPAQANDPALAADGAQGRSWADQAWAGRSWAGADWAQDGATVALAGRSWAGRSWAGRSWAAGVEPVPDSGSW